MGQIEDAALAVIEAPEQRLQPNHEEGDVARGDDDARPIAEAARVLAESIEKSLGFVRCSMMSSSSTQS